MRLSACSFQTLNARKTLVAEALVPIIENVATYLECLPLEAASPTWSQVIPQCDIFLRKLIPYLPGMGSVDGLIRTMTCLMKLPGISAFKVKKPHIIINCSQRLKSQPIPSLFQSILDPFPKILSYAIQNYDMKYQSVVEVCHLCHRGFARVKSPF